MRTRKTLKELTLKDNFLFGAVMSDENNCHRLLELILQIPIERVIVSKEKSILYHPEYKGVRLDVYAKDENQTHYNVERQEVKQRTLGKRSRYYHSHIDMEMLESGAEYSKLPDTYVIFICDFDPFGHGKYRYTFESCCLESSTANLMEGRKTIFLNTHGTNPEDVPEAMVKFLNYVKADLVESTKDFEDDFVKTLQKSVQDIKGKREMEESYMTWRYNLFIQDERYEAKEEGLAEGLVQGKAESIVELLTEIEPVPEELQAKIMSETDLSVLKTWLKLAAKSESMDQFLQHM